MKQFRESTIRWKDWDYSQNGMYFITINTKKRIRHFGYIKNKKMYLSIIGHAILHFWNDIPRHFNGIITDAFVVMPDHIHGIIIIKKPPELIAHGRITPWGDPTERIKQRTHQSMDIRTITPWRDPQKNKNQLPKSHKYRTFGPLQKNSIPLVVAQFKSTVTRWCRKNGHNNFAWQRLYYERILFDQRALHNVRQYIYNNIECWDK